MTDAAPSPLAPCLTRARWIWPESLHWDLVNGYALFRHAFELADVPATAPLFITADQSYQLYLNGHYIGRGPGRGYQSAWPCDEIDIRSWLRPGRNVLAVRAYNPGCGNYQYRSEGYAGLLVAADWGTVQIATGDHWRCRRQAGVRRDTVPASLQLFRQEHIDLRIEDPAWMEPDFDDATWTGKIMTVPWNAPPWHTLRPRGTARLEEPLETFHHVIGTASGTAASGYAAERQLGQLRHTEGLAHAPADTTPDPLTFAPTAPGTWQSTLIDFGKPHIGAAVLDLTGATGGETIEVHHFETCTAAAATITPDFKPDAHGRLTFAHRLTCRPGANHHAFYHPYGARYVVLVVRDNPAPLQLRFQLRSTLYPLAPKGAFAAPGDPQLEAIWQACAWTQRICSLDTYVDTPSREQAQWWGDARVQAWSTFHLDGDPRLLANGIRLIAGQTTPEGVTYGHAPTVAHHCILPDFTLIWILTLWDHYWQTGDLTLFREQRPMVDRALDYFRRWICPETGLLRYDERHWLFLDWADLPKNGRPTVYTLWLLHALDRLTELHRANEDTLAAQSCTDWAAALRLRLSTLVTSEGLLTDGYAPDGTPLTSTSVHAQTLALITHLVPEHHATMLAERLLPAANGGTPDVVQPSAYWQTYVYTELGQRGHGAAVIEDIRQRWSAMADHGATWETFDPPRGEFSFSHAWSAHPLFHLMQILGGIRQTAPAWQAIAIRPTFHGPGADVTVPTPHGPVRSQWQREGDQVHGRLEIPPGISAHLILPNRDPTTVAGVFEYHLSP